MIDRWSHRSSLGTILDEDEDTSIEVPVRDLVDDDDDDDYDPLRQRIIGDFKKIQKKKKYSIEKYVGWTDTLSYFIFDISGEIPLLENHFLIKGNIYLENNHLNSEHFQPKLFLVIKIHLIAFRKNLYFSTACNS